MASCSFYSSTVDIKPIDKQARLRSHKGNVPTLPQTKECWLCPAKFTRTTHLNRHLRSHANQRLHRCEICPAEFTRSDLLARHRKSCGESRMKSTKSRQKSCQACAGSKIKCDLQYPCQKCVSRGRDCIFLNDPEASRQKKFARERGSPGTCDQSDHSPSLESRDGSLPSPSPFIGDSLLFSSPENLPGSITFDHGPWSPPSPASSPPEYHSEFEFGTPTPPLDTVFDYDQHAEFPFPSSYSDPYISPRPVDPSALYWDAQHSWHGSQSVPYASLTCHHSSAGTSTLEQSSWTGYYSEAYA